MACLAAAFLAGAAAAAGAAGTTERVSVGSNGEQGNRDSGYTTIFDAGAYGISSTGRFVALQAQSSSLVPGDTNRQQDIFVRDRSAGTTTRITLGPGGVQANGGSFFTTLSANGRYVAFGSGATNLIANDGLLGGWVVHDRRSTLNERVSVSSAGDAGNAQPGDAEFLAFARPLAISADGRYVAFFAVSNNLVPGDTNDQLDVFVRDRQARTTERVSVATGGAQATGTSKENPFHAFGVAISADGRYVAFASQATNLVANDSNDHVDVFVHDRQAGTTQRVSLGPRGQQANARCFMPSISANGRYVAFVSQANNLVVGDSRGDYDVFVRDRRAGTTQRVSVGQDGRQANSGSLSPSVSANGRLVAFVSNATNLVPGDTNRRSDIFVRDRQLGRTERVSLNTAGGQATWASVGPVFSADGRVVAFQNPGPGLVPEDTNNQYDVFVRTR